MPGQWDESKFERAGDGKFAPKGQGGSAGAKPGTAERKAKPKVPSKAAAAKLKERKAKAAARAKEIVAKAREKAKATIAAGKAKALKMKQGRGTKKALKAKQGDVKAKAKARADAIIAKAKEKAKALKAKAAGVKPESSATAATKPGQSSSSASPNRAKEVAAAMKAAATGDFSVALAAVDREIQSLGLKNHPPPNSGVVKTDHDLDSMSAAGVRYWNGDIGLSTETARKLGAIARVSDELGLPPGEVPEMHSEVHAVHTVVHEALHGYSPITRAAYKGYGAQIEEVTTEVVARVVAEDMFAIADKSSNSHPTGEFANFAADIGSYGRQIDAVTYAIADAGNIARATARGLLTDISAEFKMIDRRISDPDDAITQFSQLVADHIAKSGGNADVSSVIREMKKRLGQAKIQR